MERSESAEWGSEKRVKKRSEEERKRMGGEDASYGSSGAESLVRQPQFRHFLLSEKEGTLHEEHNSNDVRRTNRSRLRYFTYATSACYSPCISSVVR